MLIPGFAEKSRRCGAYQPRYHWSVTLAHLTSRPTTTTRPAVPTAPGSAPVLPPSVARVAARTRLSAELLAAVLEVERRTRATLEDIERADALAERLLVRRGARLRAAAGRPR